MNWWKYNWPFFVFGVPLTFVIWWAGDMAGWW
jgi:hypothetical protein